MAKRLQAMGQPKYKDGFKVTLHPEELEKPLGWKKPRRIFVVSMGDLFHPEVPFEFIDHVYRMVHQAPQHTYLWLTKRPERLVEYLDCRQRGTLPNNLHIGVTAENQEQADKRIPILLQIPAKVRFVSVEPMLSEVNLLKTIAPLMNCGCNDDACGWPGCISEKLHWVICGGESGSNARPVNRTWVRSLRDQCNSTSIPFFFKSWGEWTQNTSIAGNAYGYAAAPRLVFDRSHHKIALDDHTLMERIGKKASGHLIDNEEWRQFPEATK
jgi:protein gp37